MLCVVCEPGDQTFPVAMFDVRITLSPWQNAVGPLAEIVALELTVIVTGAEVAEQPEALVTVTV